MDETFNAIEVFTTAAAKIDDIIGRELQHIEMLTSKQERQPPEPDSLQVIQLPQDRHTSQST